MDDIEAALLGEMPAETIDMDDYQAPSLARHEWEYIEYVLARCDGNITRAAKELGIHRQSLQRKLRKYPPTI
jgi:two-component system response regulator RegA